MDLLRNSKIQTLKQIEYRKLSKRLLEFSMGDMQRNIRNSHPRMTIVGPESQTGTLLWNLIHCIEICVAHAREVRRDTNHDMPEKHEIK